jgi:iron-sulfur cluster repair protein YtfE (RIC family)
VDHALQKSAFMGSAAKPLSNAVNAPSPQRAPLRVAPEETKDILQLLLEGHEQLRGFTALAVQLGHSQGASPLELSEAARRLLRYFTHELPLHLEEEEQGLLPRLFTTPLTQELIQQLWELEKQHDEFEARLERLMPLWTTVARTPERYPQLAERLAREGRQFLTAAEKHVLMEERVLFPFVRERFSPDALVALAAEVLLRRQERQSASLPERPESWDTASESSPLSP